MDIPLDAINLAVNAGCATLLALSFRRIFRLEKLLDGHFEWQSNQTNDKETL